MIPKSGNRFSEKIMLKQNARGRLRFGQEQLGSEPPNSVSQIPPTVLSRARGWISDWDMTVVWVRKRSTIERANGRTLGEVTKTGASPSRAASSKRSRIRVMNSESFEGAIARFLFSPSPTIDSANACSHLADSAMIGR